MKKLLLFAFVFCMPFIGSAQEEATEQANKWEWNVTPFFWFTGSNGDFSVNNINNAGGLDTSFSSSVASTFLPALAVEVKKGNWSIMAESAMLSLDEEGSLMASFSNIDLGEESNTTVDQVYVELGGAYSFVKLNTLTLDVLVGARYVSAQTKIKGSTNNLLSMEDISFVDPYVGARFSNYWGKFGFGGRIDVGGFGVGSQISYKYNLMVGYQVAKFLELQVAYQSFKPLYDEDGFSYSVSTSGPLLGLNFKF